MLNSSCITRDDLLKLETLNMSDIEAPTAVTSSTELVHPMSWLLVMYLKLLLYIVIVVVAALGNLTIVLVICLNHYMRKSTNYYIMNLAVCDLSLVVFGVCVEVALTFTDGYWNLGSSMCKLSSFGQTTAVTASVLTLMVISLDRYFGIVHGFKRRTSSSDGDVNGHEHDAAAEHMTTSRSPSVMSRKSHQALHCTHLAMINWTTRHSVIIILVIWLSSLFAALPTLVHRKYTMRYWAYGVVEVNCDDRGWPQAYVEDEHGCIVRVKRTTKRLYYVVLTMGLFVVPGLIMMFNYTKIMQKLWFMSRQLEVNLSLQSQNILIKRKKAIKILISILILFFICWSPLGILLFVNEYMYDQMSLPPWWHHLSWLAHFMAYSNTAINPIVYAILNENFQKGIRDIRIKWHLASHSTIRRSVRGGSTYTSNN